MRSSRLATRVVVVVSVVLVVVGAIGGLLLRDAMRDSLVGRAAGELALASSPQLQGPGPQQDQGRPLGQPGPPIGQGAIPSETAVANPGVYGLVILDGAGEITRAEAPLDDSGNDLTLPSVEDLRSVPVAPGPDTNPEAIELVASDGTSHLVVAVEGPNGEGVLLRTLPLTSVEEDLAGITRLLGLYGLVAGTLLIGGLSLAIRRQLAPVDRVTAAANRIAGGDLDTRIDLISGPGDLVELADTVDHMTARLAADRAVREETEARLRDFVADASHELRTPLTALQGHAGLFRIGALADPAKLATAMERIDNQSQRMARLVDDLLDMTEADRGAATLVAVDLVPLAVGIVHDVRAVDAARDITLDAPATPLLVQGDTESLTRVLENLIGNARKHTPPTSAIRIRLTPDDTNVIIAVEDDGPGMSGEERARVFDRFWRADRSRARAEGSSGLGLAIVHAIVTSHKGTIAVDATDTGGTRFTVRLPFSITIP